MTPRLINEPSQGVYDELCHCIKTSHFYLLRLDLGEELCIWAAQGWA